MNGLVLLYYCIIVLLILLYYLYYCITVLLILLYYLYYCITYITVFFSEKAGDDYTAQAYKEQHNS